LKLVIVMLAISHAFAVSRCGLQYARERFGHKKISYQALRKESGSYREDDWNNIRIAIEYYQTDISSSGLNRAKAIINDAIAWLENVLNVKRLTSNIVLSESFVEDAEFQDYEPPESYYTEGVEADYLFFIGFVSDPSLDYVGAATYISQDSETDQPIIGQFDLNYYNGFSDDDLLSTTIHEMSHALGFDNRLFEVYINDDGDKYDDDEVVKVETVNRVKVHKIVTPTVVKKAREGFGCDSLDGLELELQGGEGTALSHWEKRLMYNDYMSPDSGIEDVIYSDITMALFEDSGWYTVNYEYTQPITWGYKMGCDLIDDKCIEDEKPQSDLFCVEEDKLIVTT